MEIKIYDTAAIAAKEAAKFIEKQVRVCPISNIGFATGRTMDAVYHNLVQLSKDKILDCSKITAFAIDEYIGLAKANPVSFEAYLTMHLFDQLNFNKHKIHIPNVFDPDHDQASFQYEELIKQVGGIQLQILGIGRNGHIGFNEPGSSEDCRTRIVALTSSTKDSNQSNLKDEKIPSTAMTMGLGTIMEAEQCVLIATGETKAEIIQRLVHGDINSHIPASVLKRHPNATLILDLDAAKLIK